MPTSSTSAARPCPASASARACARKLASASAAGLLVPALLAALPWGSPAASAAGRLACRGWVVVHSPNRGSSSLSSVSATSARDAWAVGSNDVGGAYKTLIEHWNGTAWRIVSSPDPASGQHTTNTLTSVVALSKTNAWAIGFYEKHTTSFRTLVLHWNGSSWSVVPSPNSGTGENTLLAIAARNATDIWAVGYHQARPGGSRQTLTEHWGGSRWRVVHTPNIGSGDGNLLFGAAVDPAGRAWAVGTDPKAFSSTLALRHTASGWTVTHTIDRGDGDRFLQAVTAPAAGFALAVGSDLHGEQTEALAERWTGSAWSIVPAMSPGADYNTLQAVAATSATSAWAVGSQRSALGASFRTLAEHWDGTSWTAVTSPSPGAGDDSFSGLAAVPHGGGFWAVGSASNSTLIEHHC
jgi:hypothetical protein